MKAKWKEFNLEKRIERKSTEQEEEEKRIFKQTKAGRWTGWANGEKLICWIYTLFIEVYNLISKSNIHIMFEIIIVVVKRIAVQPYERLWRIRRINRRYSTNVKFFWWLIRKYIYKFVKTVIRVRNWLIDLFSVASDS